MSPALNIPLVRFLFSCFAVPVMEIERDELINMVGYALWRNLSLRPKKRSLEDAKIWATKIVEHLEQCRIEFHRKHPCPGQITPTVKDRKP